MRIAFVTFSVSPFGSNDLLYYKAAQLLLASDQHVLVSPYDWGKANAPEYGALARLGAIVQRRKRDERRQSFLLRQVDKLRDKLTDKQKRFAFLKQFNPDLIVVNDPGTYAMIYHPGFAEYLLDSKLPYLTISQYNDENSTLNPGRLPLARRFFPAQKPLFLFPNETCRLPAANSAFS